MQTVQNIIGDFKNFIDLCGENLWVHTGGLEENFKIYVDKPENHLDQYLTFDYEGTPLWFYFLCFDYSLFDYFKERIELKSDWDYTLLFNVDYIESSDYFKSLYKDIYHHKLNPFCPVNVLSQIIKYSDGFNSPKFSFDFPTLSFKKLSEPVLNSAFFKHAKINFNISSLSHILENDEYTGISIIHETIKNDKFRNVLISQLSESRLEDFFNLKINFLFHYPQYCSDSFQQKLNPQELKQFVTDIISSKKSVDKQLLFQLMGKEHLILAICTQYFSSEDLSSFIKDKEIHYHLLQHKLSSTSETQKKSLFKKNKI